MLPLKMPVIDDSIRSMIEYPHLPEKTADSTRPIKMPEIDQLFDIQINGYAGVDFNADRLTPEALHEACAKLLDDGVSQILATVITDTIEKMAARLANLAALRAADPLVQQVVAGFHIEGPFISPEPGYVGAHPVEHVVPPTVDAMQRLLDAADGLVRIVTLAPETDAGLKVTRMLVQSGVVVAAGHCNATMDQLLAALDAGLGMFTHLGNGCPAELPRHDNIVQRVLSIADRLFISFIADGAHVPLFALGNYLRLVPAKHVIIVSDAIGAAGCGPGTYTLGGQSVEIGDDLVPWAEDGTHLMGSACPLARMVANLRSGLDITDDQIHQWFVDNPRRLLRENL